MVFDFTTSTACNFPFLPSVLMILYFFFFLSLLPLHYHYDCFQCSIPFPYPGCIFLSFASGFLCFLLICQLDSFSFFFVNILILFIYYSYTGCLKIDATHLYDNDLLSLNVFSCQLERVYAWSRFYMDTGEGPFFSFFETMHVKDPIHGNVFGGTFSDSFQQILSQHRHWQEILQSTSW